MLTFNDAKDIKNPIYHELHKLPKYNGKTSILGCVSCAGSAKLLFHHVASWERSAVREMATYHAKKRKELGKAWGEAQTKAHLETFGCEPTIFDYKISGIGRDEYSTEMKDLLRQLAQDSGRHIVLYSIYDYLSRNWGKYRR